MKKLIFASALMFGVMFTSCGNSTSPSADKVDTVAIDSLSADTASVDSVCLD